MCSTLNWEHMFLSCGHAVFFDAYSYAWGPNRVFGKTGDYGFLRVKKVIEDTVFGNVKKGRLKNSPKLPHVKTKN